MSSSRSMLGRTLGAPAAGERSIAISALKGASPPALAGIGATFAIVPAVNSKRLVETVFPVLNTGLARTRHIGIDAWMVMPSRVGSLAADMSSFAHENGLHRSHGRRRAIRRRRPAALPLPPQETSRHGIRRREGGLSATCRSDCRR